MGRTGKSAVLGIGVVSALMAGCPVGCPSGNPQTLYAGPQEEIAVQRVGPCSFKVVEPPLKHQYPRSEAGFYWVDVDGYPIWRRDWVTYDERTATFTVDARECKQRVESFSVGFQHLLRTTNQ